MLVVNLAILLLFLISFVISLKNHQEYIKSIDKKEHKLYALYPLADLILSKTGLEKLLNRKNDITKSIKALYITSKPEVLKRLFWCSRISMVIVTLMLFDLLSILGQLTSYGDSLIKEEKYIARPGYGEGSSSVDLSVTLEEIKNTGNENEKSIAETQDVTVNVEERSYTNEELNEMFEKSYEYLKLYVLGKNESSDQIYHNLYFCSSIPGTSINVNWQPEDNNLIQSDGTVINDGLQPEGVVTSVGVELKYLEETKEYHMSFTIMPRQYSKEELLRKKLTEEINQSSENSAEEEYLKLPETLDKYQLHWSEKKDSNGELLLFLGIILAAVVWFFGDKELEKQMKKRNEQMLLDYPEIINKFTLLVNAGMTVKQAWNKIVEDYSKRKDQKKSQRRYAYEEMLTTAHELRLGIPENLAFEQYGRRVGLIPYLKFSSLITQNLKKGTKGFTELLMREAIDAFEDRKEIAKRLGEEAGTKLLIPMMLMLVIVFLIIMIPAFKSFSM